MSGKLINKELLHKIINELSDVFEKNDLNSEEVIYVVDKLKEIGKGYQDERMKSLVALTKLKELKELGDKLIDKLKDGEK